MRVMPGRPYPLGATWDDAMFGYKIGDPQEDLAMDTRDNVAFAPLADDRGKKLSGDTILMLFNASHQKIAFTLPGTQGQQTWNRVLDTARPPLDNWSAAGGKKYELDGRSIAIFLLKTIPTARPGPTRTPIGSSERWRRPPLGNESPSVLMVDPQL